MGAINLKAAYQESYVIFGKDAECVIRKWLLSNIVYPFNCTLSYLSDISHLPPTTGTCRPDIIADNYYNNIQLVWNSASVSEECIPGCHRWDYQTALQQSQTLVPFSDYTFNLEASFNDLQYEYVREVYTTSVPGFMSQIGEDGEDSPVAQDGVTVLALELLDASLPVSVDIDNLRAQRKNYKSRVPHVANIFNMQ
ncbi:hypothetical protein NECAME_09614 [Necator americanus]|uniref:Amiloride-sensitive sodium channel n=1 Tax=Necator americanus TaxID=51031 RepID=W2TCQ3_NECAM|nr:hypothetical protein NECAME_09614 [Necator americanus]ETN79815.1 hypothetical protein NECAME_09614 [Necator americanus]